VATTTTKTRTVRRAATGTAKTNGPISRRLSSRAQESAPPRPRGRRTRARNLVIVESPAKARTVENILGDDYRVIASVGHVRDLPNYGYGVNDIEHGDFTPKYVVVKDKRRGVDKTGIIQEIAEAAKDAERVYLSTDPDREGEAISWHIREAAGIPEEKTTRVVFHEITKPAIEEAFSHPGKLDMHLVDAQQTRRVLDRLIGFPLTWFVQGKVSKSASAGRVQSVALRMIVEREREILKFVPQEYWTMHARLARGAGAFTADLSRLLDERGRPAHGWLRPPKADAANRGTPAIPDKAAADRLTATFNRCDFLVKDVKKGERRQSPAPPFTTSTFQQAANNRLGMGGARAMGVAQGLYEGISLPGEGPVGLITYMRTDSLNISSIARGEARRFIGGRWGHDYVPDKERVYRSQAKGAQEAHEAIRPTSPARTPESLRHVLDREHLAVYRLIWERFVASQMTDARFATVRAEIDASESAMLRGTFAASAQQLIFPGHLAVYGRNANEAEEGDEDQDGTLPELAAGDALARQGVDPRQHFTEPPPRYTEATLVKALEEQGIGRPSTYATIVQTVQKRDYVTRQGRALVPQELGFLVNDLLVEHVDEYVAIPFTSALEEELDEIAEGKRDYHGVVKEFWQTFSKRVEKAKEEAPKQQEETEFPCNVCSQANLVIKWGRNGKFFACPRYPECSNSLPIGDDGKPLLVAKPVETHYLCPKCGSATIQKSGPYGPYIDCTRRDTKKCDFRAGVPVGVECPEEPGKGQLVEKRTKRGIFYGCWNYPHCSYTTNSLEPAKISPVRSPAEREAANKKLLERSARGKAAFAARRASPARARKAS
jgi:DNA topoisomerase-1